MPYNEKPSVDQRITATNGAHIEKVIQEVHIHPSPSLTEDFVTSTEKTESDILATIVYFIMNATLYLSSWLPALLLTNMTISAYHANADDPTTPIALLILIPLIILTIPWVPEKILRIKIPLSLKVIYAWVMCVIVLIIIMVIANNTEL